MKKNRMLISFALIILLVLASCGAPEEDGEAEEVDAEKPKEEQKSEETEEEAQEPEEEPKEAETDPQPEEKEEMEDGKAAEDSPDVELGDYEVFIGGEMIEKEDNIIINGESNLLPGARVIGEVSVGDEEDKQYFADTTEIIQDDGTFHMEIANHNLDEETEVAVKFHFDGQQDDGIIRHYGDRGQELEGPYIYKHQGEVGGGNPQNIFKQAKATATFEPGKEKAVRHFKEPDWHPIPEDMGDPRIWIEVDEINNDKEFFYLQGRSNLVEGSNIFVNYGSNRLDETRILPDGSFYLKFPYEYKEDTPFEIDFKPSHHSQWNEVEERYGKEGQKLVGDLVVQDKYSDKQYVQKVIEQESAEIEVPDNVELNIEGSEVTMLVPDNVLFDFDKYDLKDSSKDVLKEISETLATSFNKKDLEIVINGHTDNVGKKDYNLELSEKRAKKVKEYLEEQLKETEASFTTKGYGDAKPIASNDTEKGQAKNRRVEIVINLR
ncbi:OmpA family protein [Virgibacillus sp. W0181]|uniref:OmpA family protein n=1 Tax=Virgibacillus sp. W0181 TaxID=3391581 RepID=UPI003F468CBB